MSEDLRTDADLLAAHVAGDTSAFGVLFTRHRDRLWAVALRTMGNPEDAADGLQDGMIAAYRRAGSFRGDAAVTTWLHRVVVNACLDRLRAAKVRRTEALPDDLEEYAGRGSLVTSVSGSGSDAGDPADLSVRAERRRAVLAALALLPAEQRAALVLVDMEGYSVAEVAQMLDCPEGTGEVPVLPGPDPAGRAARRPRPPGGRGSHRARGTPAGTARRPTFGGHHGTSVGWDRRIPPEPIHREEAHMPDPDPQAHDREDDVRRLLAEARYDGPVPVDVAARLDRVLEQPRGRRSDRGRDRAGAPSPTWTTTGAAAPATCCSPRPPSWSWASASVSSAGRPRTRGRTAARPAARRT